MDLEIIEWNDAWAKQGDQIIEDLPCKPQITRTVGYVVKENRYGVVIAPELWPDEPNYCSYPSFIPKKMIISRTKLAVSAPEPESTS